MLEYKIPITEAYFLQGLKRFHQQSPWRYLWPTSIGLLIVLLGVMSYLQRWESILIVALALCLVLLAPRIYYKVAVVSFRKTLITTDMRFALTPEAIMLEYNNTSQLLDWDTIAKAIRFNDGYLMILTNENAFWWWADTALVMGTIAEVNQLLAQKGFTS